MELTTIIERYRSQFDAQFGAKANRQVHRAINAVLACHTERYGEMRLHCSPCDLHQSRFHSCGHRSCHQCQHHDTVRWLERQSRKLLPVEYFMATFSATAPALPYLLHPCSRPYLMSVEH